MAKVGIDLSLVNIKYLLRSVKSFLAAGWVTRWHVRSQNLAPRAQEAGKGKTWQWPEPWIIKL